MIRYDDLHAESERVTTPLRLRDWVGFVRFSHSPSRIVDLGEDGVPTAHSSSAKIFLEGLLDLDVGALAYLRESSPDMAQGRTG